MRSKRTAIRIGFVLLGIALLQTASLAGEQATASSEPKALGIALEEYPYPWPVHFLPLTIEGQELRMAYMDVAPSEAAMYSSLKDATKEVLDTLTPREAKVLRMRFGIEMSTDHTLEEVGKQFDVTRERIRQIEAKALRKLRHPSRSDKLKSFLEGN